MKKPMIAVTPLTNEEVATDMRMRLNYLRALLDCGALPVVLPLNAAIEEICEYAEVFDGLLFSGGPDIDPKHYGEQAEHESVKISAARDKIEMALFHEAYVQNKPMLGICRGLQLFNVCLGGTLYQDIKSFYNSSINHDQGEPYDIASHDVSLVKSAPTSNIFSGDTVSVNTAHHQAIKEIAAQLAPFAISPDGLIEGIYHKSRDNFFAVQWHPEYLYLHDGDHRAIFETFVSMCK